MELHNNHPYSQPVEQTTAYSGVQAPKSASTSVEIGAVRVAAQWTKVRVSDNIMRRSVSPPPSPEGSRPPSNEFRAMGMNREVKLQDEDGQDLRATHTYKGKHLGIEVAVRVPGHKALSVVLEKSYTKVYNQKTSLELIKPRTLEIQNKINELDKKLQKLEGQRKNLSADATVGQRKFFDSNYHREFMKEAVAGQKLTASSYESMVQRTNPGLVNARVIKLLQKDGQQGLLRLGVMSDLTNGTTNLQELKAIVAERKVNGGQMTTRQEQAIKALTERMKAYEPGTPARASLEMAVKQMEKPEEALKLRQERMDLQMLQYLAVQAERDPSKLEGDTWNVVDVRLLTPSKDEMDVDSGWVHNEANEMRDMQDIFKTYSGKTIVLDGKGPYVGDDGKVHLPIFGNGREVTLKAALLNISIQGDTKYHEVQQGINDEAIRQLKGNPALQQDPNWKGMLQLLETGKSNGTVAEMAVTALVKSGFCVSVGCLSAKDRTGWVVGRAIIKLMADTQPEIRKYLTTQLIGAKSVASQVLKDVTGWRFMKLDYKTMGEDATLGLKMRHTLGLVSEWGVDLIKKKIANFTPQFSNIRERVFTPIINW